MVRRRFFGEEARPVSVKGLVRAEGLEPSRTLRSNGFSYHPRLSPPPFGVCGLDYPFTVAFALGAARLVSTPSRPDWGRAWLGIAMLQGSPNLSSSAPPVSRRALKFFRLSPMRLPIPPRPRVPSLASLWGPQTR